MSDSNFNLDLKSVEENIEQDDEDVAIVLGVLDGSTPPDEWTETVDQGNVLVLAIDGDLNKLAAGFARDVKDLGANLVRFREFLIVSPAGVTVDSGRV